MNVLSGMPVAEIMNSHRRVLPDVLRVKFSPKSARSGVRLV